MLIRKTGVMQPPFSTICSSSAWFQARLLTAIAEGPHTALSDRDRQVYRAYAMEGEDIGEVAKKFGLPRNSVSQIKTRIEKRIIAAGREMIAKEGL